MQHANIVLQLQILFKQQNMVRAHVEFHIRGSPVTVFAHFVFHLRVLVNLRHVKSQVEPAVCSVRALVTLFPLLLIVHLLNVFPHALHSDHNFSTAGTGKLLPVVHISSAHRDLVVVLDVLVNIATKVAGLTAVRVPQDKMFPQGARISRRK